MLALLFVVSIVIGFLSYQLTFVSGLAGFVAAKWGAGKQEGKPGKVNSVVVSWRKNRLHLHHWVLASGISLACALQGVYMLTPEIFHGFLGGLVFQGIYCYGDWHRIISVID